MSDPQPARQNSDIRTYWSSRVFTFYSDLSDYEWTLIAPMLPPQKPKTGRPAKDHRNTVNAILWVKCCGHPWRHLPSQYGPWSTAASRYYRWRQAGIWDRVQATLDKPGATTPHRQYWD
jgi:transposase